MTKLMHLTTVDISLELLVGHQLRAALREGYEVIGVSADGPWVAGLERDGIRHVPLPRSTREWNPIADLHSAVGFWRILRQERPDIVHTHNPKPGLYGRVLARLARVPIVVNTVHGLYATTDDSIGKRCLVYSMEAMAALFSDHELVQSAEDVATMRRYRLVRSNRVTHLGNGVDLDRFDPELRRATPAVTHLEPGLPVIGAVGRLVEEKGWRDLFAALDRLSPGLRFECLAVGPTDPDKADALTADEVGEATAKGVQFLGLRHDMPEIYSVLDLFVLPSYREGFPRAAMEAAAMGVPVIASDIRGCREVVVPEVTGVLVPPGDAQALANAIERLLTDHDLRHRMGDAAMKVARERFDSRRVEDRVLATYREVAASKGLEVPIDPARPRPAFGRDVPEIARIHMEAIPDGFLSSLGRGFLAQLYRGMVRDPQASVLVVTDPDGRVVAFVAGTRDTALTYKRLLMRRAVGLGLAALPALAIRPGRIGMVLESVRYPARADGADRQDLPAAELLAIGVVPEARSRGIGGRLMAELVRLLAVPAIRVVVGMDNGDARRFYRAQNFDPVAEISIHAGKKSEILVWRSSSP